jgi:hypothetical protein
VGRNNVFYSNGTDVTNFPAIADQPGSIILTEDPFIGAASRNYAHIIGGGARGVGCDINHTLELWNTFIGGQNPPHYL